MVLYTVTGKVGEEGYLDIAKSGDLTGKNIYVNMTNKCPCSCVFCLRQTKKQQENNTLWLKDGEPSIEEVLELFSKYDLNIINELVFCGFGEPTEAFDVLKEVASYVKKTYNKPIRINTNGVGNLINKRDIVPEMEGLIDTVSISLNDPDKKRYNELVRSKFGDESFDAMLSFAKECTKYIPNVVLTTVDTTISHEEEAQCQKICDDIGAKYRIRPWEE